MAVFYPRWLYSPQPGYLWSGRVCGL